MGKVTGVVVSLLAMGVLAGCATPKVVSKEQPDDYRMSCAQLEDAMAEADDFRRKAEKEKGVTGTNVAAALFFWPAILGTYANAEEAIEAAEDRKSHLMKIYRDKGCTKG